MTFFSGLCQTNELGRGSLFFNIVADLLVGLCWLYEAEGLCKKHLTPVVTTTIYELYIIQRFLYQKGPGSLF